MGKDWKNNIIVKKIIQLRKEYVHHFAFGTTVIWCKSSIENFSECATCGTLSESLTTVHHKKDNNKTKHICSNCDKLWYAIPKRISEIRKSKLKEITLSEKDLDVFINEINNSKDPNDELIKAANNYKKFKNE